MGEKMTDFGEEMKELITKGVEQAIEKAVEAMRQSLADWVMESQTAVKKKMGKNYAGPSMLVAENDKGGREIEVGGERTQANEMSLNLVSLPAISVPQMFDEIPVKVYHVQIPATTLHAPNSVIFHVESIKRALTPILSNEFTKNDKDMVYNLHENEYGKVLVKPYVNYKNVMNGTNVFAVAYLMIPERDGDVAVNLHSKLLKDFPKDVVSLKRALVPCFYMGRPDLSMELVQQVLPVNEQEDYIYGMLAFPLLELGRMADAKKTARKGFEINKEDPWVHPAICHVLQFECRIKEALEIMKDHSQSWNALSSFMITHNWWHVALCYLEGQSSIEKVLEVYDCFIWKELERCDATAVEGYFNALGLLLRVYLRGRISDFGDSLKILAEYLTDKQFWHLEWNLELLILWALACTGKHFDAGKLLESLKCRMSGMTKKKQQMMQGGIELAESMYRYGKGDYELALELLGSEFNASNYKMIGASEEQLDVFNEMRYIMLLNTGRAKEAISGIEIQLQKREAAPFFMVPSRAGLFRIGGQFSEFHLEDKEAKILLRRLEYQRGKIESALRVFDGIDLQAAIQKIQPTEKQPPKKGRPRSESGQSQHPATLLIEGMYIKVKCLQKLGKTRESAKECGSFLDDVDKIFTQGVPDGSVDSKLQETFSHATELLPELLKICDCFFETITAYRRALLSQWNLESACCARIQTNFAVLLLYCGVEVTPPTIDSMSDGPYVPRNSSEEAILLLMIVMSNFQIGKAHWDPSVIEHLTYALSLCGQTFVLEKQLEEIMPGLLNRADRWKLLSLCFGGLGKNGTAINMLRKSLHKHENPDDFVSLLLAAKICSEDSLLAAEGVGYARRAINNAQGLNKYLEGVSLRILSLFLAKQSKVSLSDYERSRLQSEALKSLDRAVSLDPNNSDLNFDLGVQYAEHRNLNAALHYAKKYTGGSILKGWRLLILILSAQQRFSEAQVITDVALDETAKWDQGTLLKMKAKLKGSQSLHKDSIESYSYLLALVQVQQSTIDLEDKVVLWERGIVMDWPNSHMPGEAQGQKGNLQSNEMAG